jgi:hypothetical protein
MDTKINRYIKFSLVGVALSIVFFLIGAVTSFFKDSDVMLTENTQSKTHHTEGIKKLDKAVQRLESSNLSLEKKNMELQAYIESIMTQLASLNQNHIPNNQKENNDTEPIPKGSLLQQSITDDTENQTIEEELDQADAEMSDQFSLLEDTVANEEADPEWSSWAENEINTAFSNTDFEGLKIVYARCQSTICRIELSGEAHISVEETLRRLPFLTPWQAPGFFEVSGLEDPSETPEVVLFLAREGHTLPELNTHDPL